MLLLIFLSFSESIFPLVLPFHNKKTLGEHSDNLKNLNDTKVVFEELENS